MGEYFPLNFSQITCINSVNLPSTIKQRNNRAYAFWSRALYERALSVFKFILPEDWIGPQKELMKFVLARNGFGAVSYDSKFGHFFSACVFNRLRVLLSANNCYFIQSFIKEGDDNRQGL